MGGTDVRQQRRDTIIAALEAGATRTAAAAAAGISLRTYHRWLDDDEFRRRAEEALATTLIAVEDAVFDAITADASKCQMLAVFWLQNRAPDRWQDRRNLSGRITVEHESAVDAELRRLAEELGMTDDPAIAPLLAGRADAG